MIKVAFASTDQSQVNLHFGAAERFVIYRIAPGEAELVGIGEFTPAIMTGDNRFKDAPVDQNAFLMEEVATHPDAVRMTHEDKVAGKLAFLQGCAAVYAVSIGASSIKRIMAAGIQPVIVNNGSQIIDHLNAISIALHKGGMAWVDKAKAGNKPAKRFDDMAAQGWGDEPAPPAAACGGDHAACAHSA